MISLIPTRRRYAWSALFLFGALLFGVQPAFGQVSSTDARVLRDFHQDVIANIRTAEIARTRARESFVRRVADNAARNLRQTRFNVEAAARQNRINLSTALSGQGRSLVNRVSNASGGSFDRVYLDNTAQQMRRLQQSAHNGSVRAQSNSLRAAYRRSISVFDRIHSDVRAARARL